MSLPIVIVDAFAAAPFGGNPAAVVQLARPAPDAWMQAVAAEVNLSETAFVCERPDGDHDLRWFTPTVEVALCGHATLATAHVLGAGHHRFHTQRAGVLEATAHGDGTVTIDLPANPPEPAAPTGAAEALGLSPDQVVGAFATVDGWLLVEVVDQAAVEAVAADRSAIEDLGGHVIASADTTAATVDHDVVSRVFPVAAGIAEDPVTGAAHCVIGPWMAARHGRPDLAARQASTHGGELRIEVVADRVRLSGHAVTVIEGQLVALPADTDDTSG